MVESEAAGSRYYRWLFTLGTVARFLRLPGFAEPNIGAAPRGNLNYLDLDMATGVDASTAPKSR